MAGQNLGLNWANGELSRGLKWLKPWTELGRTLAGCGPEMGGGLG